MGGWMEDALLRGQLLSLLMKKEGGCLFGGRCLSECGHLFEDMG